MFDCVLFTHSAAAAFSSHTQQQQHFPHTLSSSSIFFTHSAVAAAIALKFYQKHFCRFDTVFALR
jgi:hypothetical protein